MYYWTRLELKVLAVLNMSDVAPIKKAYQLEESVENKIYNIL